MNSETKSQLNVEIITVTPELAKQWLQESSQNRPVRSRRVDQYAREMGAGRWRLTGEAIQFDTEGALLNGQHRLSACVKSGQSFETLVIRNLAREAGVVLDSGASRNLADILRLQGEINVYQLGAAIRLSVMWEAGTLPWSNFLPTIQESLAWLERNPGIRGSALVAHGVSGAPLRWVPSSAGAFHYRASKEFAEEVAQFVYRLRSGTDLPIGHPILAFRRWLENVASQPGKRAGAEYLAVAIKSFNAYLQNRKLTHVRWGTGEPFPELLRRQQMLFGEEP